MVQSLGQPISNVDLPIMIPHPVVGIAILSVAGRNHWLGRTLQQIGIECWAGSSTISAVARSNAWLLPGRWP